MVKSWQRKLHDIHIFMPISQVLRGLSRLLVAYGSTSVTHLLPWPWQKKFANLSDNEVVPKLRALDDISSETVSSSYLQAILII